jgi:hypothetical protein
LNELFSATGPVLVETATIAASALAPVLLREVS